MSRILSCVVVLVVSVSVSGCGVVFGGTRQSVRLDSSPAGAKITTSPLTQDLLTPSEVSLERRQNYAVTFSAAGYAPKTVEVRRHIRGGIVVLDILFGLVPIIVDAATGGWWALSPTQTSITLDRLNANTDGPAQLVVTIAAGRSPRADRALLVIRSAPAVRATVRPLR